MLPKVMDVPYPLAIHRIPTGNLPSRVPLLTSVATTVCMPHSSQCSPSSATAATLRWST